MTLERLFRAIDNQEIELVEQLINEGVELDTLSRRGTALYRSVKLHSLQMTELLVENGANVNIVQLDFEPTRQHDRDGFQYTCVIHTPIDLLGKENNDKHNNILKYLLENRRIVDECMIERRVSHCQSLWNIGNHEDLFDYFASCFLRKNMYDHLYKLGPNAAAIVKAAVYNRDPEGESLEEGGTHEVFFTLGVRSLFEQLVLFKSAQPNQIETESHYEKIQRELIHNLEAYNLLMDVDSIPDERSEDFYPSIAKSIIKKLNNMECEQEYTLPMKWDDHAVCLTFIRKPDTIVIRIDNLNIGEIEKHTSHYVGSSLAMIPKIIGEILSKQLDKYEDYFISLLRSMKQSRISRDEGIKIVYHNKCLDDLDTTQVSRMTGDLKSLADRLKCFTLQAKDNCFVKSHEPGQAIRSNDGDVFRKKLEIVQKYTEKFSENSIDMVERKVELEKKLFDYWLKEPVIGINVEYAADLYRHAVVWVDKYIGVPGNNEDMKERFRRISYPLYTFTDVDEVVKFIRDQQDRTSFFLIVSGTLGQNLVPRIYDCSCIIQIYIFCGDTKAHINWASNYIEKVVIFDFDRHLLIKLTDDIGRHLEEVAEKAKLKGHNNQAVGLYKWIDWLYGVAITNLSYIYEKRRDRIKQLINDIHH